MMNIKRIIIIQVFIVGIVCNINSQSVYYDAIKLGIKGQVDPDDGQIIFKVVDSLFVSEILKKYVPKSNSYTELYTTFHSNPFIELSKIKSMSSTTPFNITNLSSSFASFSSIGGINVTNFADGIAKFMVERFKKELSMAFFNKFKEDLSSPKYSDLKILFPETEKTLMTIDKDIYQYSAYLNTLRQSFIKDMTNQYVNLQRLLNQQKYKDYFNKKHPELGTILYTSLYFINGLSTGKHPGCILAEYDPYKYIKIKDDVSIDSNIIASIKTIKLISNSLRSTSSSNYWIPADSVRLLLQNEITFKIFMGLIFQEGKEINFTSSNPANNKTFQYILTLAAQQIDSLDQYNYFLETFINNAQEVNEYLTDLKVKKKSEIDYNDYYKLFSSSLDLFDQAKNFVDLPFVELGDNIESKFKNASNKLLFVARSSGELYIDARTKNYSSGIMNLLGIFDIFFDYNKQASDLKFLKEELDTNDDLLCDSLKAYKSNSEFRFFQRQKIMRKINNYKIENLTLEKIDWNLISNSFKKYKLKDDIQKLIVEKIELKVKISSFQHTDEVRKYILKYGSFIASVAEAQNSDDVKNVIESIALPAGSYSVKRNSKCNIALNGYMGFGYDSGNPFNNKLADSIRNIYNLNWNISAPVGVSFSASCLNKKNKSRGSFTAFVSMIDIGSIANFRLKDDTTVLKRTITLSDIFSPGLSIIYGLPRTPVSFSVGCIYKPKLLYDNKKNDFLDIPGMFRWNASILVDIPIVNFKTKAF